MKRKLLASLALVVVILIGAAAYYIYPTLTPAPPTAPTPVTPTVTQPPPRQYKMALILGGDETDAAWHYMAVVGAQRIRDKYGWQLDISRQVSYADGPRVARDYAQKGYDLVWAQGGQFLDAIYAVAKEYPNVFFSQVAGPEQPLPPPNVVTLHPAFQTTGYYQAGVLAGKMTKTNAVGMVLGQFFGYIAMEFYAFKAGVEKANPNAKVYARVAGTWGDSSLGFQIAKSLIETKNVDIVAQIADLTGRGVIAAAQQYKIKVIGTVADQAMIAPDVMLTSVMMDTPGYMETIVKSIIDGTFKQKFAGKVADVDLGYLAPFHRFEKEIPQEVKDLVKKTEEGIKNRTITVPRTVTREPPADPT